jgi:hypothetical protein
VEALTDFRAGARTNDPHYSGPGGFSEKRVSATASAFASAREPEASERPYQIGMRIYLTIGV